MQYDTVKRCITSVTKLKTLNLESEVCSELKGLIASVAKESMHSAVSPLEIANMRISHPETLREK